MLKKIITILTSGILSLMVVKDIWAFTPTINIQDLPEYTNTDTFKISYSALYDGDVTAKFYVRKDSDSTWKEFGGTITGASGLVQVTGSQIYDGDGLYRFKVEITGASAETDTRIDRSGPSGVSNYRNEKVAGGYHKISWKNPHDSDFSRVFIYRSDKPDFDANGTTKVYEIGGAPDAEMYWDNVGLDSNKDYYYAIRAIDKAGNASSLVSDNVTITYITPAPSVSNGTVRALPKEEVEEKGNVLGEGDESKEESVVTEDQGKNIIEKTVQFAKDRTKITVGIVAGLGIVLFIAYKFLKKKQVGK